MFFYNIPISNEFLLNCIIEQSHTNKFQKFFLFLLLVVVGNEELFINEYFLSYNLEST